MVAESFLKSLGQAVIWKGLDRLAGLLKHVVIAATIGLTAQLDVFYMAVALLGVLVFSWANLFDVVAVPSMVKAAQEGRLDDFKRISAGMFTLALAASLVLMLILLFGKEVLAGIALGFEPERKQMLADAVPWLIPVVLFYIPLRLMGAVLRSLRRFSPFYQAEFLTAFVVLLCVLLFKEQGHVLLWSFSIGIAAAFVFLLVLTRQYVLPLGSPISAVVRSSLKMAPGLLVLQGAQYVYVLTDRVFISFLPQGAVSVLAYALTLIGLLPGLISLSGSFITVIAEQVELQKRSEKFNDLLSMTTFLSVAATAFMLMAGQSMVQILLERGLFTAEDTKSVAAAIAAYAWMIPPLFLIGPLDQVFQVEGKIGLMVRRTLLGLVANIILSAWFLFGLGWGVFGVAFATALSYWVMLLTGLYSLARLGYTVLNLRSLFWFAWNSIWLGAAYGGFLLLEPAVPTGLLTLVVAGILTLLGMAIAGFAYPGRERHMVHAVLQRLSVGLGRS